jgi:Peptidase family C25/FlgD Ig-like domain
MIDYYYPDMQNIEVYDTSQGSWESQISNNINAGVSYFNYRGFANMSGFDIWHINNNLSNGFMLPVAVLLTCITGDFEGTIDCRSEAFLKAGTPSNPKGAIAAIATATGNTHTCFNNCVDAGIFYGLFVEDIPNMGAALNRGKLNLYINYPGNPGNHVNQFSYWNTLMGDPGMDLWSAVPQTLTAIYENQLQAGANYIEVNVTDASGTPQENAWVTILQGNDDIFETAYTDADGNVLLSIPEDNIGEVQLTITKRNFIPYLGSFDIAQAMSFVSFSSAVIDDDNNGTSVGNNDGIINPGETIELSVSLQNNGTQTANNITAVITTECDFITINDGTETFGNIPVGNTAASADDFDFTVSADAINSNEIEFEITILEGGGIFWTDHIYLPISAPELAFQDYVIDDGNNGILYPGETADLQINISNIGSITAENVQAELSCLSSYIIINDNIGTFGDIASGATIINNSDPFDITALTSSIPASEIVFSLNIYNSAGYDDTIEFTIVVGEAQVSDPLGPDEFDYYCYDDGDVAYLEAPVYQWIEIDPAYGGNGTMLQFFDYGNMGDTENVDLPFILTFYGMSYNTATICSNGWLAPGETDLRSFMNWEIPGPLGPSPIIAPFWDDLMTNNGDVFYYYNSVQHFFVVEWSRMSIEYNGDEETFQIIIYDQVYYPSTNGNNIIKFQYQVVNNVDQGSYGTPIIGHGQFATVGIEDQSGTIGLQYTYDNQYPNAAKTLENEMAICFNGPPAQHIEPFLILGDMIVQDENSNGVLEYGEIANLQINLNNIGQNAAHNIQTVLSCSDPNAVVTASASSYNDINGNSSGLNLSDFVFDVADDCPDGYLLPFQLDVTCSEDNWLLFFSLEVSSPNIVITNIVVEDGNNHIFNPGETADVILTMENIGGAEALNLICDFTTSDPYATINTTSVSAGNVASGEIIEVTFEMMVAPDAPLQHEIELIAQLSTISNFTLAEDFNLYVTQVPVYLEEHFNIFPPTGWRTESASGGGLGWQQNPTNAAGGEIPELICICVPEITANERIESPIINTLGSIELELEYKQFLAENLRNYTIRLETTDDGENWNTVWEHVGQNLQPHTNYITIDSPDVGSATFQFAFVFEGSTQTISAWLIDDFLLEEVEVEPHGFIVGNVVLNGGSGNVEEVLVSIDGFGKNPDENGNYILPIEAGTYDVSAFLPQYSSVMESGIDVIEWQVTEVNFSLDPITINNTPQNLTAEATFNDVHLEWEIPGSDNILVRSKVDKNSQAMDNRSLTGYNVYRNNEVISTINDIFIVSYNDLELDGGDYLYYVTAVYDEGESVPSNIVDVSIELIPPQELVYQITYPNMVLLQWDAPLPSVSRDFSEYRVYRNNEMIAENIASTFFFNTEVPAGSYAYYVTAMYGQYESEPSNEVQVEMTNTDNILAPLITELGGNHPNPFNPTTAISFSLHEEQEVSLEIYNIKGEKVRTLQKGVLPAKLHSLEWNGENNNNIQVSSGIYFYRMIAKEYSATKKMIMLK